MKKIFSLFVIAGLLFSLNSCSKEEETTDDTTTTTTTDDDDDTTDDTADDTADKSLIDESGDDLETEFIALIESDGIKASLDFAELMGQEGGRSLTTKKKPMAFTTSYLKIMGDALYSSIDSLGDSTDTEGDDDGDDFNPMDYPGVFSWNADSSQWEHDSTGITYVVFEFPTKTSATNNAALTITSFEMDSFLVVDDSSGESKYEDMPTNVVIKLEVNSVKLVDINFQATWEVSGDDVQPVSVDASVFVKPFDLSIDFDKGETNVSLDMDFKKGALTLLGADITMSFAGEVFESAPQVITADVDFFKISLDVDADFTTLDFENDSTISIDDVNEKMTVKIYTNPGAILIGTLQLAENPTDEHGDPIMTVLLANGNTITLESFLTPIADKIQDFICENFADEDDEDCL